MKNYRIFLAIVLTLSVVLGASIQTPASAQDSVTISFLSGQDENTGYTRIILELTEEYIAEHPNVKLEFEYYAQTDLQGRIQQLAAAGALPTLFPNPANDILVQMNENGKLVDIEAVFNELGIWDQVNSGAAALLKAKENNPDGLYELPVELNIEGFWYNKQIFADNGIEVPTTWDDLLAAAETLDAAGIQPFSASGQQGWPLTRLLGGYAVRYYGLDAMARVASGDLKLTDEGFVEAADILKQMADKGYFGLGVTTIDYDTAMDVFLQGEAAMFYMGSWALGNYNDPERNLIGEDNIGLFNVPLVAGRDEGSLGHWSENAGLTLVVNADQYNDVVADWLGYVFSNFADRSMSEQGTITGFNVNNMPDDVPPLTQMTLEKIASAEAGYLWWEALFNAVGNQASTDQVQVLVSDSGYSGEDYMKDLQKILEQ